MNQQWKVWCEESGSSEKKERKKKSEARMTASILKQDPNTKIENSVFWTL